MHPSTRHGDGRCGSGCCCWLLLLTLQDKLHHPATICTSNGSWGLLSKGRTSPSQSGPGTDPSYRPAYDLSCRLSSFPASAPLVSHPCCQAVHRQRPRNRRRKGGTFSHGNAIGYLAVTLPGAAPRKEPRKPAQPLAASTLPWPTWPISINLSYDPKFQQGRGPRGGLRERRLQMISPSITVYYPTIHRLACRPAGPHLLATSR